MFVIKNTPLLVRLLTITVSFPYIQKWEITPFLTAFLNSLEEYRPNEQVSFSQEWNDFQNYLSTIQPTIGHRHFLFVVRFCVFQNHVITPKLASFLIDLLIQKDNPDRLIVVQCLNLILSTMKPKS
jgi:hypothetical protein